MKRASPSSRPPDDPLERARLAAEDARDIARDELRRVPEYGADEEEITARHDMSPHQFHVHVHQSQPDIDEPSLELGPLKARNLPRWLVISIVAVGLVIALGTALAAHFAAK